MAARQGLDASQHHPGGQAALPRQQLPRLVGRRVTGESTFREAARAEGRSTLFRSPWRDADPATHPDRPFVIRVRAPEDGETVIRDVVQGDVTIRNDQLDDMIVLRSDGTPVYMLAVVVDDHDMGVTHVIRGDDHLNNAARQMLVYDAMGWAVPVWAHIPLIHGPDGKKLSKRHGALGVDEYQIDLDTVGLTAVAELLGQGLVATVGRWLAALPDGTLQRRPALAIVAASAAATGTASAEVDTRTDIPP